jgi:hypothetical protein
VHRRTLQRTGGDWIKPSSVHHILKERIAALYKEQAVTGLNPVSSTISLDVKV